MPPRGEPTTAAEWMARLRSERATQEDRDAYERWLEARPEHRASAASLNQVWEVVGALEGDPMIQAVLAAPRKRRRLPMAPALRLAAAILISLSLAATGFFVWQNFDAGSSYETASGEQRVVDLADGSRLHLNVTTRLEVALRNDLRDVRLVRGQAYFEVVPDPDRPFVVTAGDKEITVIGTKFDVLLQEGETRVTVIEGRVAVSSLGSPEGVVSSADEHQAETNELDVLHAAPEPAQAANRLELMTRDAISWPRSAPPSPLAPEAAVAAVEAWRSGRVVFDSTPLREAIVELDRYTPVRVRLAAAELGSMTVSGVFFVDRLANIEALVFALESSLPVEVERHGDDLLLVPSS